MTRRAFTLIEVVIAMGLVSFAVLTTVALLSVGNDTNKRARDDGFAAQIAANEFSRLRSLSAATFPSPIPSPGPASLPSRFFNSDMKETSAAAQATYELRVTYFAAPSGTADAIFNAEVRNPPQATNPTVFLFTSLMNVPTP